MALGKAITYVARLVARPFGYLAFALALLLMSAAARLLGETHELGFFCERLSRALWRYPEVTRRGVQMAWLAWALLFVVALSPFDPLAYYFTSGLGFAHLAAGRYEEAIEWADRALQTQPRFVLATRYKLVCLAHLGRTAEASDWLQRVLALHPGLTVAAWKASWATAVLSPQILALYVDGLRKAGLPDE